MPVMFNTLLDENGISPTNCRLIRHKDNRSSKGCSPYELWRDPNRRNLFEFYQSTQHFKNRDILSCPYWAVFIANFQNESMFVGLYRVLYKGILDRDVPQPHIIGEVARANTCDEYQLDLDEKMSDLIGKLFIEWGKGKLAWIQYADRNNKFVLELRREFKEEQFPGYLNFVYPLSHIFGLPKTWEEALSLSKGVYLLTCPKTKEQYVGSATGDGGFLARWNDYLHDGHGGNLGLKSRDPSDYQVSILEVAGSSATEQDICRMEGLWQRKLQSREMGLNRNLAGS